ncbi:hypothetical protein N7508_002964 [Penicillium antarcticum]|uniref:uncharacterized protein n=1 Tax=Penicillium antarcticum TaxID=416450 RepID=UPI0023A766FA|nr:uncharacterized protein N7508_002964 [Penicillium antarcticum]KAJ5312134.1 hypothetical protein N7508_002964 [Penicillium antarcticum]
MAAVPSPSVEDTANLNILCQTLPPPGRFPIRDLPLSTTIGQLRARIAETFPGNPPPSAQRLIYQGRGLLDDSVTLRALLPFANNTSYAIHLVLPPPEPTPVAAAGVSSTTRPPLARPFGPGHHGLFGDSAANTRAFGQTPPAGSGMFGTNAAGFTSNPPANPNPFGQANPGLGNPFNNSFLNGRNPFGQAENSNTGADDDTRLRLANFRVQIEDVERQLEVNFTPSMIQHIINIRTELLGIQDIQFGRRRPLPEVGELIARIMNTYTRACQLESLQSHERPAHSNYNFGENTIYLLTRERRNSQYFLAPNAQVYQNTYAATAAASDEPLPPQPPQNQAMAENVVRQAIPNQQRHGVNIEQAGLAHHMSRIWLFARLWIVCYLTSDPGSWRRYIMVAISVLATFLSGTEVPGQILRAVLTPAMRHLEDLARAGGPADPASAANNARAEEFSLREQLRRLERSILLLVASIVPGLGERQVEARNAAEAEAERMRQQQMQAQQEQEAQTTEAEASSVPAAEEEASASQPEQAPAQA